MLRSRAPPASSAPTTLTVPIPIEDGALRYGVNTLLITLHADSVPWSYFVTRCSIMPPQVVHVKPTRREMRTISKHVKEGGYEFDSRRWRGGATVTGFRR